MKTTATTRLAAILLIAAACTKESSLNQQPETGKNSAALNAAHYIGERFGGGVIFYLDTTGLHGLIADTVDLPITKWSKDWKSTGATSTRIGSGLKNTKKIILAQGDSLRYAARECWISTRSGYKDWFLPSRNELHELVKHKDVVGGFVSPEYWSSSEDQLSTAYTINTSPGNINLEYKTELEGVRAIRAF